MSAYPKNIDCLFFKNQLGIIFKFQAESKSILVIGSTHISSPSIGESQNLPSIQPDIGDNQQEALNEEAIYENRASSDKKGGDVLLGESVQNETDSDLTGQVYFRDKFVLPAIISAVN